MKSSLRSKQQEILQLVIPVSLGALLAGLPAFAITDTWMNSLGLFFPFNLDRWASPVALFGVALATLVSRELFVVNERRTWHGVSIVLGALLSLTSTILVSSIAVRTVPHGDNKEVTFIIGFSDRLSSCLNVCPTGPDGIGDATCISDKLTFNADEIEWCWGRTPVRSASAGFIVSYAVFVFFAQVMTSWGLQMLFSNGSHSKRMAKTYLDAQDATRDLLITEIQPVAGGPPNLPRSVVLALHDCAVQTSLAEKRAALLGGIDQRYVATIQHVSDPSAQLLIDLTDLNRTPPFSTNTLPPLITWLENAEQLTTPRTESEFFRRVRIVLLSNLDK